MKPISLLSKYAFGALLIASAITSCKKGDAPAVQNSTPGFGNISYFAKATATGAKTTASR